MIRTEIGTHFTPELNVGLAEAFNKTVSQLRCYPLYSYLLSFLFFSWTLILGDKEEFRNPPLMEIRPETHRKGSRQGWAVLQYLGL